MSLLHYDYGIHSVSVKKLTEQTKSLIIALSPDQLLVIKVNNEFEVYSIRNSQILYFGQIPKQFVASEYIKPITKYKQKCVYLVNNEADICKLYYKENKTQIVKGVLPNKLSKAGCFSAQYRVLDLNAQFLLGWVQNIEKMTCTLFTYDWVTTIFSNTIQLGLNFFNFIISNMSQTLTSSQINLNYQLPLLKFFLISQDQKRIYINGMFIQVKRPQNETQLAQSYIKSPRIQLLLKQGIKKTILSQHFPKIAYFIDSQIFILTNHREGYYLLIVDIDQPNSIKLQIQIKNKPKKEKGNIRKFLGNIDNNLIFTVHFTVSKMERIYYVSVKEIQKIKSNTVKLIAQQLIDFDQLQKLQNRSNLAGIASSIDGLSFNRFYLEYDKIAKLCMRQNQQFQSLLKIETFYKIPKQFLYSQIAQHLNFSSALTHQILNLL